MKHAAIRFRTELPDLSIYEDDIQDWEFTTYGNTREELPTDAPPPKGKLIQLITFVDANLLHDLISGKSVTGVLHFINKTPIDWYTKKQSTVETATYGSEFIAARIATEQIMDLRLTLRYLGVRVRSAIAAKVLRFLHIPGKNNPADILSKTWGYSDIWHLLKPILFWPGNTEELL